MEKKSRLVEKAYLLAVISKEEESECGVLLDESDELVSNLGIKIFHKKVVRVRKTHPGYLIGKGKFNEIIEEVSELGCDVIIDNELLSKPTAQLGGRIQSLVIDRQEIILDVFMARA